MTAKRSSERPRTPHGHRRALALPCLLWLALAGCSAPQVEIEPVGMREAPLPPPGALPTDVWTALAAGRFDLAEALPAGPDERAFAKVLESIVSGDVASEASAVATLRTLRASAVPEVRKPARSVLGALLLGRSDWAELAKVASDPAGDDDDDHSVVTLARAFARAPAETYAFPREPVALETDFSLSGSPIVEVVLNGERRHFWLDTGAGLTVVASDVAEDCHVSPLAAEAARAGTATSRTVGVTPAILERLEVGGIAIRNHPAMILRKEDLEFYLGFIRVMKIDGILGWNAFRNMSVTIDYERGRTTLGAPEEAPASPRAFFWLGYPIVTLRSLSGAPLHFGLDTGARSTTVTDELLRKIGASDSKGDTATVHGVGGSEEVTVQVLPRLEVVLDDRLLRFSDVSTARTSTSATFLQLDGILGSDLGRGHRLSFDARSGRFSVTASPGDR